MTKNELLLPCVVLCIDTIFHILEWETIQVDVQL